MPRWILMLATLGVAVVPTDARLVAGFIDHDKVRRCSRTAAHAARERGAACWAAPLRGAPCGACDARVMRAYPN